MLCEYIIMLRMLKWPGYNNKPKTQINNTKCCNICKLTKIRQTLFVVFIYCIFWQIQGHFLLSCGFIEGQDQVIVDSGSGVYWILRERWYSVPVVSGVRFAQSLVKIEETTWKKGWVVFMVFSATLNNISVISRKNHLCIRQRTKCHFSTWTNLKLKFIWK